MAHYAVRFALPDRPGNLGAVATELGRLGANITWLRVIEVSDGMAVDEIQVDLPARSASRLVEVVGSVDGVVVEYVRPAPPDVERFTALALAAELVQTPPERAVTTFVNLLPAVAGATWAVAIDVTGERPRRLAASHGAPPTDGIRTPWVPLPAPRSLHAGTWTARWLPDQHTIEFAAAPLTGEERAVIVARPGGPRFRSHELQQLGLLAHVCALRLHGHAGTDLGGQPHHAV